MNNFLAPTIFFLTIISIPCFGQKMPEVGIKGGITVSSFNDAENVEIRPGITLGGYARFNVLNTPFSVQPEVLYAQFGTDFDRNDSNLRLDYVQIPVLVMYRLNNRFNSLTPFLFAGPYVGFLSNTVPEGIFGNELQFPLENGGSILAEEAVNNTDYGLVFGAEINLSNIVVGLRYNAGLNDVFEDEVAATGKNAVFSLIVGIAFN